MQRLNKSKSRVLLVLPTLGGRIDLLDKTLLSIINQNTIRPEIILVCPPSATTVKRLAKKYNASVAEDPGTLSGALNIGLQLLKDHHEYFTWLGDDDLLRNDSIITTTTLLDSNPKAVIAYGACDYIDENDNTIFTNRSSKLAPWIIRWGPNIIPLPGMLYRVSALRKAGAFDTSLKYAMDLDMLLRLKKYGTFVMADKTLAAFRWHATSTTVANREKSLNEARMIKRRNLPKYLRGVSFVWEEPVALATKIATHRLNRQQNT